MNPTGLNVFGSRTVGMRYYLTILLSYFSFLVLTTIKINEKNAKILFWSLFVGYSCALVKDILTASLLGKVDFFEMSEVEFSGRYEFLSAMYLFVLCYAKYDLLKIFSNFRLILFLIASACMVVFSGKRLGLFLIGITPFLKALVYKKHKLLTFICYFIVAFVLIFAVVADGTVYNFPESVKRSLSIVVPKYRIKTSTGVQDEFRYEVRLRAKNIIRQNMWFGRKGYAFNANDVIWLKYSRNNIDYVVSTGGWHNTWLAFSCDFGIPSAILWGIFLIYLIKFLYKSTRDTKDFPHITCCLFFYMVLLYVPIILSNTTGHVASTTKSFWITSGIVCALINGAKKEDFGDAQ